MNIKINNNDLRELYREHIKSSCQFNTKDCPSTKTILGFLRSKISKKTKKKVINHIIYCYDCFQEIRIFSKIIQQEKKLIQEIEKELIKSKSAEREIKKRRIKQTFSFPKINWVYTSIIYFFLLIIFIAIISMYKNPQLLKYRGEHFDTPELILHSKIIQSSNEILLTWNDIPSTKYYIIEIFNESLYPLWKSNKIQSKYFFLKPCILNLGKGEKYFCIITAFLSTNRKFESRLQEIKLQ